MQLLDGYQSEKEESQREDDTHFRDYWESACQTIYEVAADLNIPLEEESSKPRPYKQHQPDSRTPDNADVYMTEIVISQLKLTVSQINCHAPRRF